MRLKEIFTQYAKTYASTAGKALTFDKIYKGYECLNQYGFSSLLKDYGIHNVDKLKVQFLFKRLSTDGYLSTFKEFKNMLGVLVAGQNSTQTIAGDTQLEINDKGGFT
jgi:hypothetical protein